MVGAFIDHVSIYTCMYTCILFGKVQIAVLLYTQYNYTTIPICCDVHTRSNYSNSHNYASALTDIFEKVKRWNTTTRGNIRERSILSTDQNFATCGIVGHG